MWLDFLWFHSLESNAFGGSVKYGDSTLWTTTCLQITMPSKSQLAKSRSSCSIVTKIRNPLYVVTVPKLEPVLRIWVNPDNTDDILTFSIIFGDGDVKLLPYPEQGVIALEAGCEYRVNPRIPVGFVYVTSSDSGNEDLEPGFLPPEGDLFSL